MATMADLDELALSMPQATKEVSDDGRPAYYVHGKMFCFHRPCSSASATSPAWTARSCAT